MATLWMLLELVNLIVFTLFILPRQQTADARPLLPLTATRLLRLTFYTNSGVWLQPVLRAPD